VEGIEPCRAAGTLHPDQAAAIVTRSVRRLRAPTRAGAAGLNRLQPVTTLPPRACGSIYCLYLIARTTSIGSPRPSGDNRSGTRGDTLALRNMRGIFRWTSGRCLRAMGWSVAVTGLLAAGGVALDAQSSSRCADCHVANPGSVSTVHLAEWDLSAHGRRDVGCESCHGGDPTSFEVQVAHRGILARSNPASPVYRANEPATCGSCHLPAFTAFQSSQHYALLKAGDKNVPNCATCHGEVAGLRPSPKGLEAQCAQCHGAGRVVPRPEYPIRGRQAFEGLREVRDLLSDVRGAIARVRDRQRRARLEEEAAAAEVPIREATHAAHGYVYDKLDSRLSDARARLTDLFARVANPDPR